MQRSKLKFGKLLFYFFIFLAAFIIMVPFIWTILLSFKDDAEIFNEPLALPTIWNFRNYIRAFQTIDLFQMYANTAYVTIVSEVIALISTFACSYAISRLVFRHKKIRNAMYYYFLLGLGVPVYVLLYPIYRINVSMGLLDNLWGLILPYIALTIPFNILLFVGYLNGFPSEIEEAAIIDGCNLGSLLGRIVFPIIKPIIATVTVFNVIYTWNEFPFAVTYINSNKLFTVSLATSMFKGKYSMDYSGMVCAIILIMIPELIFYIFLQRQIISGMTAGAVKA